MPDIDNLSIRIKANATDADAAIRKLSTNVNNLSSALGAIKTNKLNALSVGIKSMGDAMQSFKGVNKNKYGQIADGINKFSSIDGTKIKNLSSALIPLGVSLTTLNQVNQTGLNNTLNALSRLSTSMQGTINTQQFADLGNAVHGLANNLKDAPKVERNIVSLMGAIARLGNTNGSNVKSVASALSGQGGIGIAIKNLAKELRYAPVIASETIQLVTSIGTLANAGKKADTTAKHLPALGKSVKALMQDLQSAPDVSNKTIRLMTSLGQLASAGSKTGKMFNSLTNSSGKRTSNAFSKMKGAVDRLTGSFNKANSSGSSLARTFGKIYANYFLLFRGIKALMRGIDSSMDYVETYNYFNKAFSAIASDKSNKELANAGKKSAESYVNAYQKRAQELTSKMTGFNVANDGKLMENNMVSLGMDPNMIMNYQAEFAQMGSAMGATAENATTLSTVLTEIGLDLASLHNLDYSETLNNMSSGLVGQARVWDKFGTSIRIADMNVYLANHGISTTVKQLTSADKALLRTTILLDTNRDAWGDLSSTIGQARNSMRVLKANISTVGMAIGDLFMPMIAAVLPYINGFVIAIRRLVKAFGDFLGIEWTGGGTGTPADSISDIKDEAEDANDAQKKAAKSAKEWKNQLMGFDEINKLDDNKGSDGSGDSSKAQSPSSAIQGLFDDMVDEYQTAWNNAYANMENKAYDVANGIQKALADAWKNSNGEKIGSAMASWLNKGILWANNNIGLLNDAEKKLATIVGTGINGYINTFDWSGTGKLIGTSLKGAFEAEREFFKTVNWYNLGSSLSTSLMSFLDSDVMESFASMWGSKFRALIEFAFGAVENINFMSVGKHIGKSINAFFKELNEVNDKTGLTGWQELGKTLNDSIIGILDTLNTALDTVDWDSVGIAVAQFLNEIDWGTILVETGALIWKALGKSLKQSSKTINELDIGNIAPLIATLIGAKVGGNAIKTSFLPFTKGLFVKLIDIVKLNGPKFAKNIANAVFNVLKTGITKLPSLVSKIVPALKTFASSLFGEVILVLTAAIGGWKLGNWLYEKDVFGVGGMVDKIVEKSGIGNLVTKIADFFKFELPDITEKAKTWAKNLTLALLENIPDKLKKILGLDKVEEGIKISLKLEADTKDAESKIEQTTNKTRNTKVTLNADTKTYDKDVTAATKDREFKVELTPASKISEIAKKWAKDFAKNFKPEWEMKINGKKVTVHQSMNGAWAAANGGVWVNGKLQPVTQYANGGLANAGQLIQVREAGPELVGTIGGHTAILNNNQIVGSVSNGVAVAVANTVAPMISQVISAINNNGNGDIYVDSTKLTDAILQNAHNRSIVNGGRNVFMSI